MNDTIATVFIVVLYVILFAIVARSLMSWFPVSRDNQVGRLLFQVTEPLLAPVRNLLPRTGMIDFSAMVVIVLIYAMITVVQRAAQQ